MLKDPNPGAKPTGGEKPRKVAEWSVFVIIPAVLLGAIILYFFFRAVSQH